MTVGYTTSRGLAGSAQGRLHDFFDPIRVRGWQSYVDCDADLETLLREATGHAVAMRTPSRMATTGSTPATERSSSSPS